MVINSSVTNEKYKGTSPWTTVLSSHFVLLLKLPAHRLKPKATPAAAIGTLKAARHIQ